MMIGKHFSRHSSAGSYSTDRSILLHGQRVNDFSTAAAPWAPVLISRLRSARVWYVPRFMDETCRDDTWRVLVSRVAEWPLHAIIGPGIDFRIARARVQIASDWADRFQYPWPCEYVSLPQVAQYVAATRGDARMEEEFRKDLGDFALKRYGHLLEIGEKQLPLETMLSR